MTLQAEELVYDIEADNLIPGLTKIWMIGVCNPKTPDQVTTYTDYDLSLIHI